MAVVVIAVMGTICSFFGYNISIAPLLKRSPDGISNMHSKTKNETVLRQYFKCCAGPEEV